MERINTVSPPHLKKNTFLGVSIIWDGVCGWEIENLCQGLFIGPYLMKELRDLGYKFGVKCNEH
jgi:hypothetical protein